MFDQPQDEHRLLERLAGTWKFESEARMGPDQPPMKSVGRVTSRSLGGLWCLLETEVEAAEGSWKSIMTLGYDPKQGRYVGNFVATMMAYLWIYSGSYDATRRRLVLDTVGPSMDERGLVPYQDILEWVDDDHWILSSQTASEDGLWTQFMTAHHRRIRE